ncbi:hypothetical protein BDN67DRAFT_970906 [Paxillus ammoniavirescens]|nr:hypothetical protein BDN67DRAFT_970906 [Paxillus ammoniavirescens]
MALANTEIVIFDIDEGFRAKLQAQKPAYDMVLKSAGVQQPPLYVGSQIENAKIGYLFVNWDSYEDCQAVLKDPALLDIIPILEHSPGANVQKHNVQFSGPTVAFDKPVTEILVLTLKAPENRAAVVDILSKISEASQEMFVFGQTIEDKNKYIVVGGWPTVEAHWETVAKPDAAAALTKLFSLTTKDHHYHIKLTYYQL